MVRPTRGLRWSAHEVAKLANDVERRRAVEDAPPNGAAADHLEPGDVVFAGAKVDVEASLRIEERSESARVDIVGHREVRGVLVPGVRKPTAISTDALLVDEQRESLAALVRRVVLHTEPVERPAFVAPNADGHRIGCRAGDLELKLAHLVADCNGGKRRAARRACILDRCRRAAVGNRAHGERVALLVRAPDDLRTDVPRGIDECPRHRTGPRKREKSLSIHDDFDGAVLGGHDLSVAPACRRARVVATAGRRQGQREPDSNKPIPHHRSAPLKLWRDDSGFRPVSQADGGIA